MNETQDKIRQQEILTLNRRAKAYAAYGNETKKDNREKTNVIAFTAGGETYAIEPQFVGEALWLDDITEIPGARSFIMGVTNIHGKVISINDLRVFFGLSPTSRKKPQVIIIDNGEIAMGVITEMVNMHHDLVLDDLRHPPATMSEKQAQFVRGITPEGVIFLNAEKLCKSRELIINEE